jgi:hypothetical protein
MNDASMRRRAMRGTLVVLQGSPTARVKFFDISHTCLQKNAERA